jgi:hypothetical protein
MNHSMFNEIFNVQWNIQCSMKHSMFNETFNVQWDIQCSTKHSMFNQTFNVQSNIQCSMTHYMFNETFNVQSNIQCSIKHSIFNHGKPVYSQHLKEASSLLSTLLDSCQLSSANSINGIINNQAAVVPSSFPVSHLRSPPAPERPWYGVVTWVMTTCYTQ